MDFEILFLLFAFLTAIVITLLLEYLRPYITGRILAFGGAAALAAAVLLSWFLSSPSGNSDRISPVAQRTEIVPLAVSGQARGIEKPTATDQPSTGSALQPESQQAVRDRKETGPGASSDSITGPDKSAPAPTAEKEQSPTSAGHAAEISAMLETWRQAWEKSAGPHGELAGFGACYAADFSADGLDRVRWLAEKERRNRKKAWIKVKLADIRISPLQPDSTATASFQQEYSSPDFSETSAKTFVMRHEEGGWKIVVARQ